MGTRFIYPDSYLNRQKKTGRHGQEKYRDVKRVDRKDGGKRKESWDEELCPVVEKKERDRWLDRGRKESKEMEHRTSFDSA